MYSEKILKELYHICERLSESDDLKAIFSTKLKDLPEDDILRETMDSLSYYNKGDDRELVVILRKMMEESSEKTVHNIGKTSCEKYSAERSYLAALSVLAESTDESHRIKAIDYLNDSLREAPGDPRFVALSYILAECAGKSA